MQRYFFLLLIGFGQLCYSQTYTVLDSISNAPISYATISFGNGSGTFADATGNFTFSKKWYANVDTLYISAIGHKERIISTKNIPKKILLQENVSVLNEVFISSAIKRKYKTKKIASKLHNDYFKCWLPTVESEIAVFFPKNSEKDSKIASVYLPIKTESSNKNAKQETKFSTLFKMQFYTNTKGFPGNRLPYEDIIFEVTNTNRPNFELIISDKNIFLPDNGIFISIQVLGYTNKEGKLQQTKKYSEIETRKGIVKISTTYRPLLPFTNKIDGYKTFTRRVFYKNRTWQRFDNNYSKNNNLIKTNHTNYGMGLKLYLYEEK